MSGFARPTPRGEEVTWFDAAREHRLLYQRCDDCGRTADYLRSVCPHCGSTAVAHTESTGQGAVHSWTTQHLPGGSGFADAVPYTLVLVDLDEGVRVLAELVDHDGEPAIGTRVGVLWDDVADDLTLPRFVAAGDAS